GVAKSPGPGAAYNKISMVGGVEDKHVGGPRVHARGVFEGHKDTVEDVQFCPSRSFVVLVMIHASYSGIQGSAPVLKVEKAHSADLHCVDWNPHDSADNSVRMFDRRNLTSGGVGSPVCSFEGHSAAVLCVQIGKQSQARTKAPNSSPDLFFQHAKHRDKVVDFHWNASDPWTIVSVSDDGESTGGGGTLQMWRIIDLIYRPEEEVLNELEKFKSHLIPHAS
ncbi:hypothetical protein ACH5RR_024405, partial [Cinchona calisaya]